MNGGSLGEVKWSEEPSNETLEDVHDDHAQTVRYHMTGTLEKRHMHFKIHAAASQ